MVDYRKLLDAFIGAIGRPNQQSSGQPAQGGMRQQVERSVTQVTGQSPDQLLQKAKDFATQHPGLTQTALVGLAGLLFRGRKKGKLTGNLVKLGGLAVIGGLAYKAFQNSQAGKNLLQGTPAGGGPGGALPAPPAPLSGAGGPTGAARWPPGPSPPPARPFSDWWP